MKTTLQILTEGRALINTSDKWCQNHLETPGGARCAMGAAMTAMSIPTMLMGEWRKAYQGDVARALSDALPAWFKPARKSEEFYHSDRVVQFNNTQTHAEVLALFDRAIEAERAKQKPTDISVFTKLLDQPVSTVALTST